MSSIRFEWDSIKARTNLHKHHVSFEEAKTVFFDENARIISDPEHSENEQRFIILGISDRLHLLIVCHCYRKNDEVIRIISARKATLTEVQSYEESRS
jgi:uncharacterized DUF497 family protein